MTCTYSFTGPDGNDIKLVGKYALKAYLSDPVNLAHLLPERAAAFSRAKKTYTPAFKKWFGDSKVVDAEGKPLVVYHASNADIDVFKPKNYGTAGDHSYFYFAASESWSKKFAKESLGVGKPSMNKVYLSIQNPLDLRGDAKTPAGWVEFFGGIGVDVSDKFRAKLDAAPENQKIAAWQLLRFDTPENGAMRERLIKAGYDGIVMSDVVRGKMDNTTFVSFQPTQIKSAVGNNGQFDGNNPDIRFSKTPVQAAAAAATASPKSVHTQAVVNRITDKWQNKPEILIYDSLQDPHIDEEVRKEDARQTKNGATGMPEGFHYKGKVYIWSGLKTDKDIARVLFHEALGHYGLRGVFGKSLKPVLEQISALRRTEVIAKARHYGLVGKGIDVKKASDSEIWKSMSDNDKLQAAEEVLAVMAQTHPEIGFVKRAIIAIREWLRANVPALANMNLSDDEIITNFILPARAFVESGAQAGKDMAAGAGFSRAPAVGSDAFKRWFGDSKVVDAEGKPLVVYHGTRSEDFNVFDMERKANGGFWPSGALGAFFSPKEFAAEIYGDVVKTVYLSVKNPYRMSTSENGSFTTREQARAKRDELIEHGYDGIIIGENQEFVAFNHTQIKSATGNNGQFDGTNPDIRFSRNKDGDPSQDEARHVNDSLQGKSLTEVAQWLAENHPDADQRLIADRSLKKLEQMQKHGFDLSFGIAKAGGMVSHALANYARGETKLSIGNDGKRSVSVTLNGPDVTGRVGTSYEVALHEVVHAAVDLAIVVGGESGMGSTQAGKLKRDLSNVLRVVKDELFLRKSYDKEKLTEFEKNILQGRVNTIDDEHELLVWAMTNKDAQKWLEGIDHEGRDLWSRFVNAIRQYLGMPEKNQSALSSLLMLGDDALDTFALPPKLDLGNRSVNSPMRERTSFARDEANASESVLKPEEQGFLRRTQAQFQDSNNRVKQIQSRISEITGLDVPEYADYYRAEENRPGRIAARLANFREKMQSPLVERIAKSGHTLKQVEELAHAMHAVERNAAIAKINPKHDPNSDEYIGVEGSGMNSDVAADILEKYKGDAALQKHVADLQSIARATLDMKHAYKQVTDDQYEAYTKAYDFYVPLKGDGEYGPMVKRAMGHDERDEHIMENVMRDYEQTVVAGERNMAREKFLQLVLENPDSDLWTINVTPKGRYVAGTGYIVRQNGEDVATFTSQAQVDAFMEAKGPEAVNYEVFDEKGERVREFTKPLQDNELPVYINGQRVRIQIKDKTLAQQMRPLNQEQMGVVLGFMRDLNRWFSKAYTGWNPTFLITNPLRDIQTGTINILGNQGAGIAAKAWAQYPSAIKALFQYAKNGKEPTGKMGNLLKEYRMHGGKTGASYMSDLEEQGKTLQRLYEDAYGASGYLKDGMKGKAAMVAGRKILGGMAHAIEVMNQATENALRLSLYVAMRDNGSTAGEAAQAAKNVTVNFDKKGTQTSVMGALYLFFNPAVQGTANALRTLAKGEHKKQAWAALGTLAVLGMYAALSGIDDDEDRWLGENWDTRSKKLVMNIGGHRITLPISLEFAPFYATGVAVGEAMRGKQSAIATAGHLVSSFIDAYVPVRGLYNYDSDNKQLDAMLSVTPTVLRSTLAEPAVNRNAFGSKIVPEGDYNKDVPDNLKMNRNTKGSVFDSAAQGIAAVGEMAGAGRYENGLSKISPETLKNQWRVWTGGLGTFLGDTAGLAKLATEAPSSINLADVPVAKSFVKEQDIAPIRSRYYDLTKDARAASKEFAQAKKAGDSEAMDDIYSRPEKAELLGLDKVIKNTTKAAASIRDEMVEINLDKTMSTADKRAKLKELEKEEELIYRDGIDAIKK